MRFSLVSNYQPTKVVQPGEGSFDYPPMAVVGHLSFPAWSRPFATSFRDARLDSPPTQPVSECSRIVAPVGYQFHGATAGSSPGPRYPHRCQGHCCRSSLGQSDLRPLGAGHQGPQRGFPGCLPPASVWCPCLYGSVLPGLPLFGWGESGIQVGPFPFQPTLGIQSAQQSPPDIFPDPLFLPLVQSSPASHGTAVLSRQVLPAAARAQHIQDAINGAPFIGSGPPAS